MKKLKTRWNIQSNAQLFVIILVFAITGSTAAKLGRPIVQTLGVSKEMEWFIYWPFRIFTIIVLYQILLVFFGWLFGEFNFFWNFEKKILRSMGLKFLLKK